MAATISVDLDNLANYDSEASKNVDTYWKPENFSSENGNCYLRLEEWMKDVEEFVFPIREYAMSISIDIDIARAILRYQEELKLYSAIEDQNRREAVKGTKKTFIEAMKDVDFLDQRHRAIVEEWPQGKETALWWKNLERLTNEVEIAILEMKTKAQSTDKFSGVFIKLSVRSPKDSVFLLRKYKNLVKEYVNQSSIAPDSDLALTADIDALRYANWRAMCCSTAEDVLLMLVRSERVYLDIQHQELFCDHENKAAAFKLQLHLSPFFEGFKTEYEFRGFMSKGIRTALTQYSPWLLDEKLVSNKDLVLQRILDVWDRVSPRIRSENYSIDFAFSEDLQQCWIIEINNFLPPLAGWGVFDYYQSADKKILLEGPFEFRIRTQPVKCEDFHFYRLDERTGKTSHIIVQPADDEMMRYVANLRREKFGLPLLLNNTEEGNVKERNCIVN